MPKHRVPAARFDPIAPGAAGMPLYRAVKRSLLRAIEGGACAPGTALPSETELAASFEVSIGTVRRAVDELVLEHILVRRQGLGTFVATHTADRFLFQFFHVERTDGLRLAPTVEFISFDRIRCDDDTASALGVRPGDPVIAVENRLLLQGKAVIHDRIAISAGLFKGLTEKRFRERPGTIYQLYQTDFGITVLRAVERARACLADRRLSRVLGLAAGAPVVQVRRTALTFGDKPIEYRVSTIDTERHDYVNQLSRPA
ncbi:MAG: GntR family transcriptional regulator [Caldimonas sp.]